MEAISVCSGGLFGMCDTAGCTCVASPTSRCYENAGAERMCALELNEGEGPSVFVWVVGEMPLLLWAMVAGICRT